MKTTHSIVCGNSKKMASLPDNSVNLVVTSPPYPMIELWDNLFAKDDPDLDMLLRGKDLSQAFEKMHCQLDEVWHELYRVLQDGAYACINIGDALRSGKSEFRLFSNSARIITAMQSLGFRLFPSIVWRKQTNAPNKFMGSGMLPCGAYVTLEHEHILIFRKGSKRVFTAEEVENRRESALFWEERNSWFSDLWDIKGVRQEGEFGYSKRRTAAFPPGIPYRLINMFSVYGDTVLDPFVGTGTTILMAMGSARNSTGYETDESCCHEAYERIEKSKDYLNSYNRERLNQHLNFSGSGEERGFKLNYLNSNYQFPVKTKQEENLLLKKINQIYRTDQGKYEVQHSVLKCYNKRYDN